MISVNLATFSTLYFQAIFQFFGLPLETISIFNTHCTGAKQWEISSHMSLHYQFYGDALTFKGLEVVFSLSLVCSRSKR